MAWLEIENLTLDRGSKTVLNGVSLAVDEGQVTALLGANGAGKSSLALAAAAMLPIRGGQIRLGCRDVAGYAPAAVRSAGLAVVPEGHQVLRGLTVSDNLDVAGAHLATSELEQGRARALSIFPELNALLPQAAGSMSGGQQQMLAIAQALVGQPKVVIIDEMSLGLAPLIVKRLLRVVAELSSEGVGILLVEQFAHLALAMSDRACVMDRGRVVFDGSAQEVQEDPSILHSAYMGA